MVDSRLLYQLSYRGSSCAVYRMRTYSRNPGRSVRCDARMTEAPSAAAVTRTSASRAHRLLWLPVVFHLLPFGLGFRSDRPWHATPPLSDFFPPPHLSL